MRDNGPDPPATKRAGAHPAFGETMKPQDAVRFVADNNAQFVDVRFTDLMGTWHHFTMPADKFTTDAFEDGLPFDGSSIRGFQSINESDMLLRLDAGTMFMDPFNEHATAVIMADIEDPITGEEYGKDPRYTAKKAEAYLRTTGLGDTAFFGPEAEFFVFDALEFENKPESSFYRMDSQEAPFTSGQGHMDPRGATAGFTMKAKGGYFPCPPNDKLQDLRSNMVLRLQEVGVDVEIHHHEVGGSGQSEIDVRFDTLVSMADKMQKYKYVVKMTAFRAGMIATFMPKPMFGDNGSGMHVHQSIWKGGKTQMAGDGYAGLSDMARYYIGGLLRHAPALLAFCAPTTNSYRRLVPGYEAPINLMYSQRNRSACIRIPVVKGDKAKRVEFRAPDPTANPYLAFSACLMAGIDGVLNKIEPPKPMDVDLYELPAEERSNIPQTPGSLRATLRALREDHAFLLQGGVFTTELIDSYIDYKLENECDQVDLRPHPFEFYLYADS